MIVVFGSLNIDLVCRVQRLPAAGETVLAPNYVAVPGGKGANQALAARRAGSEVVIVGAVGTDGFADHALQALVDAGVDIDRVARVDGPTGAAFIAVDERGQNQIVVAAGANGRASAASLAGIAIGPGDWLMLQWEVPEPETLAAAGWARTAGARVMLNRAPAGPVSSELITLVDAVVVNEHEVMALGESLAPEAGDPDAVASMLSERFGLMAVVTLGDAGALAWHRGIRHDAAALDVAVVDTTAAGDTFCGALAAAFDRSRGLESALDFACAAGSLACTRFGAQPSIPDRSLIEDKAAELSARRNPEGRRIPT
jgi:ribokinase